MGSGGPNGAGKTTLFDVITGLDAATSGRVVLEGRDVTRSPPEAICHAGIARTFQFNAGFDTLSARENVEVAAIYGHVAPVFPGFRVATHIRDRAQSALAALGLESRAKTPAGELAVLERKLLMVATAMVTQPKLLMLDEPVGGLTTAEMDRFAEAVQEIRARGIAVILIEHVMRFLVRLAGRVLIMHHGRKIYEGPPQDLADDDRVVDVYLGQGASGLVRPGRPAMRDDS